MGSEMSCMAVNETITPTKDWITENSEVVKILMPVYYLQDPITPHDIEIALQTWRHVLDQTAPNYVAHVNSGETFPYESCAHWFHTLFYQRLFDVHPPCRSLFKTDIKKQGELLVRIILFVLEIFSDESKLDSRLFELAISHSRRNVRAIEYGILGEVMFWTLRVVLGSAYTPDVHETWRKIFSRMLKVLVPVSIAYELRVKDIQRQLALHHHHHHHRHEDHPHK